MGHASLRANTTGYAEKVRSQVLSLRQNMKSRTLAFVCELKRRTLHGYRPAPVEVKRRASAARLGALAFLNPMTAAAR